jgi:hypothetical protein
MNNLAQMLEVKFEAIIGALPEEENSKGRNG